MSKKYEYNYHILYFMTDTLEDLINLKQIDNIIIFVKVGTYVGSINYINCMLYSIFFF